MSVCPLMMIYFDSEVVIDLHMYKGLMSRGLTVKNFYHVDFVNRRMLRTGLS